MRGSASSSSASSSKRWQRGASQPNSWCRGPANNILYSGGVIYPIDWESAAVAAGEIDLACLTEGWPPRVVRECERRYREARWPDGAPADFERRLGAARLYLAFRWLGEEPDETVDESNRWRFDDLRTVGERLGWIEGGRP